MNELDAHIAKHGFLGSIVKWTGTLTVDPQELKAALDDGWMQDGIDGWGVEAVDSGVVRLRPKPNLVTNSGVNMGLDRLFNIGTPPAAVTKMGVDNSGTAPTATTDQSGTATKTIIPFDSTPTRTGQTVSAVGTFDNTEVNFSMRRLFLSNYAGAALTNSTTAEGAGTLYAMTNPFTIDLSAFSSWSQTFTAQITGTGT